MELSMVKPSRSVLGAGARTTVKDSQCAVEIYFDVLEPGDGVKLRIVFDGPQDAQLDFAGSCIGSSKLNVLPPDWNYFLPRSKRAENTFAAILALLVVSAGVAAIIGIGFLVKRYAPPTISWAIGYGSLILLGLVVLFVPVMSFYDWYKKLTAPNVPPEIT